MRKLFAKQSRLKPVVGSTPTPSAKVVEVGKHYRVRVDGYDDVIVKYDGISYPKHCKTCTCEGFPLYVHVSGPQICGPVNIEVLEEVDL